MKFKYHRWFQALVVPLVALAFHIFFGYRVIGRENIPEGGCVVCIEPGADMTYDIKSSVRLVNAGEYHLDSFECLRGFISGLYAGNYDISHVYVDNLCKIVHSEDFAAVEKFLHWLDKFSDANTVKFTVTLTADASVATEGMRKYL